MKYKISEENKKLMNEIFSNMKKLSENEEFFNMLKKAEGEGGEELFESEDDYLDLINFVENIIDTAKCNFNYYNIE